MLLSQFVSRSRDPDQIVGVCESGCDAEQEARANGGLTGAGPDDRRMTGQLNTRGSVSGRRGHPSP